MHSSKTQNNLFVVDAGEKWAFHHISTPLFHSIFFRGHSDVSKLQRLPKEKRERKVFENLFMGCSLDAYLSKLC
jgi:hypothetical protein